MRSLVRNAALIDSTVRLDIRMYTVFLMICIYAHMICIRMCVCMHIYIYIYIYIHRYIHRYRIPQVDYMDKGGTKDVDEGSRR